uniref:Uncharacterized protein n=1 Tax=Anguilla anguilla TaxID=7936 RepID=A0A0E9V1G2_ANGAN
MATFRDIEYRSENADCRSRDLDVLPRPSD